MDWFDLVLFLHIAVAITGMMMAAVLHTALIESRVAADLAELRMWARVIHRVEPLLPFAALVLFGTGLWMLSLSDGEFAWNDGWVLASIVGLVVAEGVGGLLVPRSKAFQAAIAAEPARGPVPEALRRPDRTLWLGAHMATALFFGVIYLMVMKPSGWASALVLVIAAVLGYVTTLPFLRPSIRGRDVAAASGA